MRFFFKTTKQGVSLNRFKATVSVYTRSGKITKGQEKIRKVREGCGKVRKVRNARKG